MALTVGDIVFAKAGKPAVVVGYDEKTARANLDENFALVQDVGFNGVRNGIDLENREAFNSVINSVKNNDKRTEIDDLNKKMEEMKAKGADPRLLRYLEGELQFRMSREKYQPVQVSVPAHTIGL